jgi:hypothetical protein
VRLRRERGVARRRVDGREDEVHEIGKPVLTEFDILLDDAAGGMITCSRRSCWPFRSMS